MPQTNTSVPLLHKTRCVAVLSDGQVTHKLMEQTSGCAEFWGGFWVWLLVIGEAILATHGLATEGLREKFAELIPGFLLIAALVDFSDALHKGMRFARIGSDLVGDAGGD
jgi:hypothetical protein